MSSVPTKSNPAKKRKGPTILAVTFLFILGLPCLIGGAYILVFNFMNTDSEGYALSQVYHISSNNSAFVVPIGSKNMTGYPTILGADNLVATKWIITSTNGTQVFAGWVREANASSYLSSFKYETVYGSWSWITHYGYAALN